MKFSFFSVLLRTWVTGVLYVLGGLGYVFLALLSVYRMRLHHLLVVVVVLCLCAGALIAYGVLNGVRRGDPIELTVNPGTPILSVAQSLRDSSVVPSARLVLLWLRFTGRDRGLQAGMYTFHRYSGLLNVSRALDNPRPFDIVATVPEGMTVAQTASRLCAILDLDSAVFVSLCTDSDFVSSTGVEARTLEGYLFPETYRFAPGADEREVIGRMVGVFRSRFATLPVTAVTQRMTVHQIVTLASIVEKEATLPCERAHIAGVFHNRLRLRIPLGADPTVRYLHNKFSGPLYVSELKNPSPYNTRIHAGLPPGPICSPGLEVLRATVEPLVTNDLYFVALWDGSGRHDFSATNAEHERKKLRIRYENEKRKTTTGSDGGFQ